MVICKVGVLGSGTVGQKLAAGFVKSGYEVMIGTRSPEKLAEYLKGEGRGVRTGSQAEAAAFGEMLVLATKWQGGAVENTIALAGKGNFAGKIVIDVTNPLLFEAPNQPPKPGISHPDSLGLSIQGWLPDAKVVKAFNTVTAFYMANAKLSEGQPDLFIAGNDAGAAETVADIASIWGWNVINIGGMDQAYLLEALALLWVRYGFLNNHWTHAFKLLKK